MSDYVCDQCGVTFSRSYNMLRHKKESCVERFSSVVEDGRKRRKINASPTSTHTCNVCDITIPRNQMSAHQRTLAHKNKCSVIVSHGVELIESAFKSRIVTYRVSSDTEHVDYSVFFNEIKTKVLSLISEVLRIQQSLKINMVVVGRYFLPSKEVVDEKSFNTSNEIVTVGSDLEEVYNSFVEVMKAQSTEFQEKDSGMLKHEKLVKPFFKNSF